MSAPLPPKSRPRALWRLLAYVGRQPGLVAGPRDHERQNIADAARGLTRRYEHGPIRSDETDETLARYVIRRQDANDTVHCLGTGRIETPDLRARVFAQHDRAVEHAVEHHIGDVRPGTQGIVFAAITGG